MSRLEKLSEDQKQQAVEKAKYDIKLTGAKLVRITEEHYDVALEFLRDYYHKDEPLHRAAAADWGEAKKMHLDTLRQNLSLMIVSETNGEIFSLLTVQVVKKGDTHGAEYLQDEGLRNVWIFVDECEKKANLFEHFGVDEAVQLVSLVSSKKHRHEGLATVIVQAAIAMVRHFGVGKVCVKGEGSSVYTQLIFEKEGMECLYKGIYDECERDGKKLFPNTGEHKSINMYGFIV